MTDQTEILTLLREIRDIQSERLQLQKQALKDQAEAMEKQQQAIAIARVSSRLQKLALSFLGVVIIVALVNFVLH